MADTHNEPLVLAVDVPANAEPGSLFHVALENRFFEVTVPEGVAPGDTINIIVPPSPDTAVETAVLKPAPAFDSIQSISDAALLQAKLIDEKYHVVEKVKQLDEQYKVSERVTTLAAQATAKAQELDAKFAITDKVNAVLQPSIEKAKVLDDQLLVTKRAVVVGERIIAYAREIDAKYAVSATAARLVVSGANAVVTAYRAALALDQQHKITERAAAVTSAVVTRAQELDAKYEIVAKATKAVETAQTVFTKAPATANAQEQAAAPAVAAPAVATH
jgi:hypothetical protein